MKPLAWYELNEGDQRVSVAQTFLWLSCAGGLIGLVVGLAAILFGHGEVWSALARQPLQALRGVAFLALYVLSAHLTGQRRSAGGLIGLALFGYSIVRLVVAGHIVSWQMGWSLIGVIVILRAWPALTTGPIAPAS